MSRPVARPHATRSLRAAPADPTAAHPNTCPALLDGVRFDNPPSPPPQTHPPLYLLVPADSSAASRPAITTQFNGWLSTPFPAVPTALRPCGTRPWTRHQPGGNGGRGGGGKVPCNRASESQAGESHRGVAGRETAMGRGGARQRPAPWRGALQRQQARQRPDGPVRRIGSVRRASWDGWRVGWRLVLGRLARYTGLLGHCCPARQRRRCRGAGRGNQFMI